MAIISRTLTVNAAFLQEIKEDNRQLRDLMQATRRLVSERDSQRSALRQMAESMAMLRDQLAMHFALEDAYGYFEDAVVQAPRLCAQAETLRNEHSSLYRDICELADSAERVLYGKPQPQEQNQLTEAFLAFYDRFQTHEQRENDLIVAAFDDDIGVGD